MNTSLFAMAAFATVGAITPGPVNVLAVHHGAQRPWSVPFLFVLGASVSYTLIVWAMGSGAGVALRSGALVQAAHWAGAAYLLYLAWRIATATPRAPQVAGQASTAAAGLQAFRQGFLTQALNPKAWLVALSGVAVFTLPTPDPRQALLLFCGVSFLACLSGVGIWALAGAWLTRWLQADASRQRLLNRALAALLCLTVAGMLA